MSTLQRTQVYIEEEQIQRLKLEAEREQLSMSELIRKAITNFLKTRGGGINWDNDPINKAVGMIELADQDAAVNHDYYLYGKKKKG